MFVVPKIIIVPMDAEYKGHFKIL